MANDAVMSSLRGDLGRYFERTFCPLDGERSAIERWLMHPLENPSDPGRFALEVFYDGGCPLCRREMGLLRRWDRRRQIRFSDISDPAFQSQAVGKTVEELMTWMHGRLPEGTWLQGVEVFRRLYAAVGFGPVVWLSRFPVVSHLLEFGYAIFARHRLRLTRRCTAESCSGRSGRG